MESPISKKFQVEDPLQPLMLPMGPLGAISQAVYPPEMAPLLTAPSAKLAVTEMPPAVLAVGEDEASDHVHVKVVREKRRHSHNASGHVRLTLLLPILGGGSWKGVRRVSFGVPRHT